MRSCVDELWSEADQLHAEAAAVHARILVNTAKLAASDAWCRDGAATLASWLSARYGYATRTSSEIVREAVSTQDLPSLLAAMERGQISRDQCKAVAVLSEENNDQAEQWLECLPAWTYPELEREARKHKAQELERRDGGVFLRMTHTPDERYMRGEFQLHPEQGAVVQHALDALIPHGTKLRDLDHAAALALVDLAKGAGPSAAVRPTVLAMCDGDVGELDTGGFVPAAVAERLACDARIQTVHIDAQGNITSTEPNTTAIPAATRRAVEARDGYRCTFPACQVFRFLECHHIVERRKGGTNDMANLQMLCWTHHVLAHEGGWTLGDNAGRHNQWFRPDGSLFEPRVRVTVDTS